MSSLCGLVEGDKDPASGAYKEAGKHWGFSFSLVQPWACGPGRLEWLLICHMEKISCLLCIDSCNFSNNSDTADSEDITAVSISGKSLHTHMQNPYIS